MASYRSAGAIQNMLLSVLLEDGSSELFWLADLSEVDWRISVLAVGSVAGGA